MKKDIRILLCVCAAIGWWGFLYPELAMTPDTYQVVGQDPAVGQDPVVGQDPAVGTEGEETEASGREICWEILNADSSQVHFRSRLLDRLEAFMEYRRTGHESGEQHPANEVCAHRRI